MESITPSSPDFEEISRQDADEFFLSLQETIDCMTLTQLEEVYLYVANRGAIAISYDERWKAFLGYSRGYNRPENRTPFLGISRVINLIRDELRIRHRRRGGIRGGRVFFTNERAYRVYDNLSEETLCRWIWRSESEFIDRTLQILKLTKLNFPF